MKTRFAIAFMLGTGLLCTACSSTQVTSYLGAALDAAIAAAGIAAPQYTPYLQSVETCLAESTTELTTMDTNAVKVTVILGDCATASLGVAGSPADVAAVIAALNAFLDAIKAIAPQATASIRVSGPNPATGLSKVFVLKDSDYKKLNEKVTTLNRALKPAR